MWYEVDHQSVGHRMATLVASIIEHPLKTSIIELQQLKGRLSSILYVATTFTVVASIIEHPLKTSVIKWQPVVESIVEHPLKTLIIELPQLKGRVFFCSVFVTANR